MPCSCSSQGAKNQEGIFLLPFRPLNMRWKVWTSDAITMLSRAKPERGVCLSLQNGYHRKRRVPFRTTPAMSDFNLDHAETRLPDKLRRSFSMATINGGMERL